MKFTSKVLQTKHDSLHDLIGILTGAYQLVSEGQESAYRRAWEQYTDEISAGVYSVAEAQRHLREARQRADADFDAKRAEINKDLVTEVKQLYAHVVDTVTPKRAPDHATRVSVALQLLSIEGKDLTDHVAADILKDFIADRDFDAMETFYRVISRQVEPKTFSLNPDDSAGRYLEKATGDTAWPETFGDLFIYRQLINSLDEMVNMAEKMYLYPRERGERTKRINGEENIVPMDGYLEPFAEATAPEMAKELEADVAYFLGE